MNPIEDARDELRKVRDRFKSHHDPQVQKIGRLIDLFILSSYDTQEIGRLCDVFDSYLNDLLGGPN